MNSDDLVMAFFPCIYFCENNNLFFTGKHINLSGHTKDFVEREIIKRAEQRHYLYVLLVKLFNVCTNRGLRLIVENPYSTEHFLYNNFPYEPKVIDRDRRRRGDYYKKPTQFFYHNCEPTHGETYTTPKMLKRVTSATPGIRQGICSEERSLISPDYARNFICDFIIGKTQVHSQLQFEF